MENHKPGAYPQNEERSDLSEKLKEKSAQMQSAIQLGLQKTEQAKPTPLTQLKPTPLAGESPEKVLKTSRAGIAATLAMGLIASSAATTTAYMYLYKKGPFAPVEIPATATSSASAPEGSANGDNNGPEEVENSDDLRKILKTQKIKATEKDFNFKTERPQLHAKALMFKVDRNSPEDDSFRYSWIPVRNRITHVSENELLVAVKVVNTYVNSDPLKHIAPEGLPYRAQAVDADDPTIVYFYYNCKDKKQSDLLGQIGLLNPQNPKKLLWGSSFSIPDCK